jgi:hypothetical protein
LAPSGQPRHDHYCVTDDSERFARLARVILDREVPLELVDIGQPAEKGLP